MLYSHFKNHLFLEIVRRATNQINFNQSAFSNLIDYFSDDVSRGVRDNVRIYDLLSVMELVKEGDWAEITNRFHTRMSFGTGGIRGRTSGVKQTYVEKNGVTVAVSGGFDPLHVGHLEYLQTVQMFFGKEANLLVIVNSDEFLKKKKGYAFMPWDERCLIMSAIRGVSAVVKAVDEDLTVCKTLEKYGEEIHCFCKGGDRTSEEVPEKSTCDRLGIYLLDGFGEKIQSSSELVKNLKGENNNE